MFQRAKVKIMSREKEPKAIASKKMLDRAEDCFAIAQSQHLEAESQHENASRQIVNAAHQQDIAAKQHRNADKLESNSESLEDLGHSLEADAVKAAAEKIIE
jgi:hypothetical protein